MPKLMPALYAVPLFLVSTAQAQESPAIPDIAQALLDEAYKTKSPEEIAAVANAVKAVFPDYADQIGAQTSEKIAAFTPPEPPKQKKQPKKSLAAKPKPSAGLFALEPWTGKAQASGQLSTGNSENASIGILVDAKRSTQRLTHNFKGYIDLGESNGVTNQKRWGGSYQLDVNVSDRSYAYGRVSFDEDQFTGFDYRMFGGLGLGYYFKQADEFTWKVEGGPGYRYSPIADSKEIDQSFALYASNEFIWLIREGVKFEQDVTVTWTEPTTTIESVSSLTTKIWGDISTGLSFEYRYETDPPEDSENTDTIAKASLIYGF